MLYAGVFFYHTHEEGEMFFNKTGIFRDFCYVFRTTLVALVVIFTENFAFGACSSGKIDYVENGVSTCSDNNFQITTIPNTKEIKFMFYAAGTYYVDCDTNSTSDTVKKVVVADSQSAMETGMPVTCSYDIGGEYTIGFGGKATNYIASSVSGNNWTGAGANNCSSWGVFRIGEQSNSDFTSHTSKIKNLSGSIGKIFPTLPGKPQPTFRSTFSGTINLTSIPGSLFNGVYGQPGVCMFVSTFYGTGVTSIPIGLFSYINGTAEGLFMHTFAGAKITSIDPGVLRTIKGPARVGMFANMFAYANDLRYLPENLFGGIYKVEGVLSTGMLKDAFRKDANGGIKKLPNTMFSDFNGKPDTATFKNIFANNTNLSGNYVPCHFFDSVSNEGFNASASTSPLDSIFHHTSLLKSCPKNMYKKTTGFEDDFDGAVVCCDCPNGGTSPAGSVGAGSCTAAAVVCPAGQYLASNQTSCSACPSAYPNSPSGARSISQCYATVTYKFNNDSEDISVDVPYSSSSPNSYSIKLPEPSKIDYIFVGWNEQQNFSGNVLNNTVNLSGNKTLYAQWTQLQCNPGTYLAQNGLSCLSCPTAYPNSIFDSKNIYACFATVTFYPNNNSDNTKENYYYKDANAQGYKISNTPATNTDYEFIGWFDNSGFSGNPITSSTVLSGNKNLYAQYGYLIEYDLDGGHLAYNKTNPSGYTTTDSPFTLNNPSKTGYTFAGWCNATKNCSNPQTVMIIDPTSLSGNQKYYATWTPNTYNIQYKNGETQITTIQTPTQYTFSESAQTFTPTPEPTDPAYRFVGWTTSNTDQTNYSKTITIPANATDTQTFYAVWTPIDFTIHYYLDDGENDSTNPESYNISQLPLNIAPATKTGYKFDGWFNNSGLSGTPVNQISINTTGEINLYAKWTPITYNIVFNPNGSDGYKPEIICTYDSYCDISNNEFTYDGYEFLGWDTNRKSTTPAYTNTPNGINVINLTDTDNETILLYAIWKANLIDLNYIYNGITTPDSCQYNNSFTPMIPPANVKPGFRFAGWVKE